MYIKHNCYELHRVMAKLTREFEGKCDTEVVRVLKYLLSHADYYNNQLDDKTIHYILCISLLYKYDKLFQERYEKISDFVESKKKKQLLYNVIKKQNSLSLDDICHQSLRGYISELERKKQDVLGFENFHTSRMKEIILEKSHKIAREVVVFNHLVLRQCNSIQVPLVKTQVLIQIHTKKKDAYVVGVGWYCEKCQTLFMKPEDYDRVNKAKKPYKLKVNESNYIFQKHGNIMRQNIKLNKKYGINIELKDAMKRANNHMIISHSHLLSNEEIRTAGNYKRQETNKQINLKATDFAKEVGLNQQSPLRKMGYTTSKSREKRWEILTNQAIPVLGKAKVKQYIAMFIRLHGNNVNMENTIREWEYDLMRLR